MVISIKFYNYFNFFFNFWPLSFQNTHCEFFFFHHFECHYDRLASKPPSCREKGVGFHIFDVI